MLMKTGRKGLENQGGAVDPVSTPKVKQAGKMMVPAISATKVSSAQMRTASPGRVWLVAHVAAEDLHGGDAEAQSVKNAWFIASVTMAAEDRFHGMESIAGGSR